MKYKITKSDKNIIGEINIPPSKSISNRILIINALNYSSLPITNLSDCEDTQRMKSILQSNSNHFDVGDAGTTMRFLTAYLSKIIGEWTLTGSERIKQRPIKILVEALNKLGAQISYLEKVGYPPLKIIGSNLTKNLIVVNGNTSSQFITALLLIAPTLPKGLTIKIKEKIVSLPYIKMTLEIMKEFGVKSTFSNNEICVKHQNYKPIPYTVEGDWSGASYWYSLTALSNKGKLKLNGLRKNSLQGDAGLITLFQKLGVKTTFSKHGIYIEKRNITCKKMTQNFINMPDLAQTFAVCCTLKNIPFHFTGLETLKIKETNRIQALINELSKLGYTLTEPNEGSLAWDGTRSQKTKNVIIETYNDHRMAMAFAPAAIALSKIIINKPDVVKKSYPDFWEQLKNIGISVVND